MELVLIPKVGPPLPTEGSRNVEMDLMQRAAALSNTLDHLCRAGMTVAPPTDEDRKHAAAVVCSYAAAPDTASRRATTARMGKMTPAALRHIDHMLKTFGQEVATDAAQIRHFVTNKLLEESDNPDPRIRMRALELLGKISEVGLFADRKEVTVTHQSTEDLKESLRSKLSRLTSAEVIDAEVVETPTLDVQGLLARLDGGE